VKMKAGKILLVGAVFLGIAAVFMGGCDTGSGGETAAYTYTYTDESEGNTYTLVVYESGRAAYTPQAGDRYELTINPGNKKSTGTVKTAAAGTGLTTFVLQPSFEGSEIFEIEVSNSGGITAITGTITFENKDKNMETVSVRVGNPSGNTLAASQLAADINNMEGQSEGSVGRAAAYGATVKITGGFVDFRENITVPIGVTLEATEDSAAIGLHDVTLTVNGTVNANNDSVRLEDTAEWGTIEGTGTINLRSKGHLLDVHGNKNVASRTLTLNGVTLVGLSDNNASLVRVHDGGKFILESGTIRGNTTENGGGVNVGEDGTFTMKGGTISGNTSHGDVDANGGGVQVNGTFIMEGGTISGNIVDGDARVCGGGLEVYNGTFTMSGGTISGNTAKQGGGVNLCGNSTFTMEGGTIRDNTVAIGGGGVLADDHSTFTMKSGTISGNTAGLGGGGVMVSGIGNVTFTKSGGIIYGDTNNNHTAGDNENTSNDNNGHAVVVYSGLYRNTTVGTGVILYAKGKVGNWIYNDPSNGGLGDTTANWTDAGTTADKEGPGLGESGSPEGAEGGRAEDEPSGVSFLVSSSLLFPEVSTALTVKVYSVVTAKPVAI
jgi:hypothetical protein